MTARCIQCRKKAERAKNHWCGELFCDACWKTVPDHLKRAARSWKSIFSRSLKEDAQFGHIVSNIWVTEDGRYKVRQMTWNDIAKGHALAWSKIRLELKILPERPAGLAMFFYEMGW